MTTATTGPQKPEMVGEIDVRDEIDTPALVVDLDVAEANLADMARYCEQHRIELVPHTKTHRTPEWARKQAEWGATRLCVAKLGEIEVLADAGFDRFVMAYPIVGRPKYRRAVELLARGVDIRFVTDNLRPAGEFGELCAGAGLCASIAVKVDTGFGRVGVAPDAAFDLARRLVEVPGLRFAGLICHEGHAAGAPDDDSLHDLSIATGRAMVDLAHRLRGAGVAVDTVSVGSTATAKHTSLVSGITEVRAGIYPFNDYGQLVRGTVGPDRCAARVVTTVVSKSAPDRAIVDAGSKSLGQDQLGVWFEDFEPGHGPVAAKPGWRVARLSEEHGWLEWHGIGTPPALEVGDVVQVLPNHICSVFHALGSSTVVRNGRIEGTWLATGRGASQ